jgi:hypothetical protein
MLNPVWGTVINAVAIMLGGVPIMPIATIACQCFNWPSNHPLLVFIFNSTASGNQTHYISTAFIPRESPEAP